MAIRTCGISPQRNGTNRAFHRFFQRHHQNRFNVLALFSFLLRKSAPPAATPIEPAAAAKKLLEKIAEPGAAEFETFRPRIARAPGAGAVSLPARTGPRAALLPIRSQFVVLFAFVRIAQDFVGFVDFLEFFLRGLLVLGHVGMVLAGQFAEGFANVIAAGRALDSEHLVIIFKLDRHIVLVGLARCLRIINAGPSQSGP